MTMKNFSVERSGFVDFPKLGQSLMADLLTDGAFSLVYPQALTATTTRATFESTVNTDPLGQVQPWRLHIDCSGVTSPNDPGYIRLNVAHPIQLDNQGNVATEYSGDATGSWMRSAGEVTCGYFTGSGTAPGGQAISAGKVTIPFASNRWGGSSTVTTVTGGAGGVSAFPTSYRLTVTDRGFALFLWEDGQDEYGSKFSWIVVQRPVDPATGATLVTGKAPVFCLYSIGGGEPKNPDPLLPENANQNLDLYSNTGDLYDSNPKIYRFTVREFDIYRPTVPVLATVSSPDSHMVIDGKQQVAINETNQYVVTLPSGFNTDRYMYKHELDLVAYTSADVIGMWSDATVTMYNEVAARRYKAMHANGPNGTCMRMLLLTQGPGF